MDISFRTKYISLHILKFWTEIMKLIYFCVWIADRKCKTASKIGPGLKFFENYFWLEVLKL